MNEKCEKSETPVVYGKEDPISYVNEGSDIDVEHIETEMLLGRIREGDQTAFEPLFNRYYAAVVGLIRQYVDESDIEDVAQEVFVNVFRRVNKIESPKAFESYLFRSAKNGSINWLKKKMRLRKMVQALLYAADSWQVNDSVRQSEKYDALKQALNELPEEKRKIAEWFYVDKRSREEIAKRLNISNSTAYRRIAEVKAGLAEIAERRSMQISFEGRHDIKIHYLKDRSGS
ncbi:MAG: sigma-70 family RNA polymerase sigma factor [Candidatus Omnitrophica bacterium]|nr:sigma-70 family RNA polymerase sigma factor [Candidatus Omnitrophota bacterium]